MCPVNAHRARLLAELQLLDPEYGAAGTVTVYSFETDCHGCPHSPGCLCTQPVHDLGSPCITVTGCILSLRIGITMLIHHHSCPKRNDESPVGQNAHALCSPSSTLIRQASIPADVSCQWSSRTASRTVTTARPRVPCLRICLPCIPLRSTAMGAPTLLYAYVLSQRMI